MYRAGDRVLVQVGSRQGHILEIAAVRMFAADPGYYLHGGEGLYAPNQVEFAEVRTGGNPCGAECNTRTHDLTSTCDHYRGTCHH